MEKKPSSVPKRAKQVGEAQGQWSWVEPEVWTERMLAALERGVKGGVWFSLIDKVYKLGNLRSAFEKVKQNGGASGADHVSIAHFAENLEKNLEKIAEDLREDRYCPQKIRRVKIPKAGSKENRPLGIPTIRDRVVQTAVKQVIEPIFEKEFSEHSYGFRPGRGAKDALREVDRLLKEGNHHIVDVDIKSYFDTIPHDFLMERIREKISDGRMLSLLESFLKQGIVEGLKEWTPEAGSPQGSPLSPLLSNIYLNPLDHKMEKLGYKMIRYADDFVVLCESEDEAKGAKEAICAWLEEFGLKAHPTKSKIVTIDEGFDFLGYHFRRVKRSGKIQRWPRKKSLKKFKDTMRSKTKRTNGHSLESIIEDLNKTFKGWFEYFKHSYSGTFSTLDSWIRMRLRSILRKRKGLRGRGRGKDHQRWPNKFFAEQGLFSLLAAFESASQPSSR